jgi:hypothetical protein
MDASAMKVEQEAANFSSMLAGQCYAVAGPGHALHAFGRTSRLLHLSPASLLKN